MHKQLIIKILKNEVLYIFPFKDFKIDIQKSAASFLLKVKERNKIPQVQSQTVSSTLQCFLDTL
jgi:hypothetical protein